MQAQAASSKTIKIFRSEYKISTPRRGDFFSDVIFPAKKDFTTAKTSHS